MLEYQSSFAYKSVQMYTLEHDKQCPDLQRAAEQVSSGPA